MFMSKTTRLCEGEATRKDLTAFEMYSVALARTTVGMQTRSVEVTGEGERGCRRREVMRGSLLGSGIGGRWAL